MHPDPFRAAAWCVLIIGTLAFLAHVQEDHTSEVLPPAEVTPAFAARTAPPPKTEEKPAAYVGNVKSHKFHRLSCRYATCPNCTTKFRTREEAIAAGYRPGGCCNP